MGAASDGVYGVMFGGQADTDIEYVTIQTTESINSTDFGDLSLRLKELLHYQEMLHNCKVKTL